MPTNPSLMDDEEEHKYLRPYRGKKADAESQAIKLKRGEIFIEYPDSGPGSGIGRMKMGDGTHVYRDLPYLFDQTDLTASFLKGFTPTTVTNDNTLLSNIANNKDLGTITAATKKLIENRIANEGVNASSIATLWSTVVTNGGTCTMGGTNGDGTVASTSATKNLDIRKDINSLWSTVFNNSSGNKYGNAALRNDINNNKTAITNLQSATATLNGSMSTANTNISNLQAATATLNGSVTALQGATSSLNSTLNTATNNISTLWSTVFSSTAANGLANSKLRADINAASGSGEAVAGRVGTLESTVFNNTGNNYTGTWSGHSQDNPPSTVSAKANKSLREDVNTLWLTVYGNAEGQIGNMLLSYHMNVAESNISSLQGATSSLNSSINSMNTKLNGATASIAGLQSSTYSINNDVTDLENVVFDLKTFAQGGKGNNTLASEIASANSNIAALNGSMSSANTAINTINNTTIPNINNSISTLNSHLTTVYNKTCELCSYSWENTSQSQKFVHGTNQNLYELTCWFGSDSGASVPKQNFGDYLIFYNFYIDNAGSTNFSSGHTIKGLIATFGYSPAVMRFDAPISSDDISWRNTMYSSTTGVTHITVGNSSLQTEKTSFKLSFTQNLIFSTTTDKVTITIKFYAVRINPMTGYM